MSLRPVKTAIVGCGNISSIYLQNCSTWPILDVVACADLDVTRAEAQAAKYGVPRALGVAEVMADPEIELIINLTIPAAHGSVGLAALRAGKSVYNEKPLALSREEAQQLVDEARARCWSAARPTPSWAPGSKPAASCSTQGRSGHPLRRRGLC